MTKYRISKFDFSSYNTQEKGFKDTWTSYSDIGKKYEGKAFNKKEYISVETQYIEAILSILKRCKIKTVQIENLEIYFPIEKIEVLFAQKGLKLTTKEKRIIERLKNGQEVLVKDLKKYLKLILRECFWCELNDEKSSTLIEFGYDYYVYVTCGLIHEKTIQKFRKRKIYIEPLLEK